MADVIRPDQVEALTKAAIDRCGTVDVLVINAGVLSVHRVEDITPDEWDRMCQVRHWPPGKRLRSACF